MQLIVEKLGCERAGRIVLKDISFLLASGQSLLVTGPNGIGKSTLLRTLAGLSRQCAGTIALEGGEDDLPLGQQAHYFGHADAIKPALTLAEYLRFWQGFYGSEAMTILDALKALQLDTLADTPASYLSAGQRRRLSFARLLVSHRPVWLLDEPTAALDTASTNQIEHLIAEHLAKGGIVIASSHEPLTLSNASLLPLNRSEQKSQSGRATP